MSHTKKCSETSLCHSNTLQQLPMRGGFWGLPELGPARRRQIYALLRTNPPPRTFILLSPLLPSQTLPYCFQSQGLPLASLTLMKRTRMKTMQGTPVTVYGSPILGWSHPSTLSGFPNHWRKTVPRCMPFHPQLLVVGWLDQGHVPTKVKQAGHLCPASCAFHRRDVI